MNNNKTRAKVLGMPYGTAQNKLRKQIMFRLAQKLDSHYCFQCEDAIDSADNLSVEHMKPWFPDPDLYWDLDNIAFSHLSCNSGARRREKSQHGTARRYGVHGCRCESCTVANTEQTRKYRASK